MLSDKFRRHGYFAIMLKSTAEAASFRRRILRNEPNQYSCFQIDDVCIDAKNGYCEEKGTSQTERFRSPHNGPAVNSALE